MRVRGMEGRARGQERLFIYRPVGDGTEVKDGVIAAFAWVEEKMEREE